MSKQEDIKMELPERDIQSEGEQEISVNRTGIMTNPQLSAELIDGAEETEPSRTTMAPISR